MLTIELAAPGAFIEGARIRTDLCAARLGEAPSGCGRRRFVVGKFVDVVFDFVNLSAVPEGSAVAGAERGGMKIGDDKPGVGVRNASQFLVDRRTRRQVADHQPAPDYIEACVGHGKAADVGDHRLHRWIAPPSRGEHFWTDVDAYRDSCAGRAKTTPSAASGVEQPDAIERRRQIRRQVGLKEGNDGLVGVGHGPKPVTLAGAQHGHGALTSAPLSRARMENMNVAPETRLAVFGLFLLSRLKFKGLSAQASG